MSPLPSARTLRADIEHQFQVMVGRAPVCHALLTRLLDHAEDPRFAEAWAERSFHAVYDRPLLLLAAMRGAALADAGHPLAAALADDSDTTDVSASAVAAALDVPLFWALLRDRRVQTNDTTRAITWRLAAARFPGPYTLVDLGCSAGLNLVGDMLPWAWSIPEVTHPSPTRRVGLDRSPLDAHAPADARWLRACIWPGELDRLRRLDAAIAAFQHVPTEIHAMDLREAPAWLATVDGPVLAYQTLVRDYLPPAWRPRYEAQLRAWAAAPGRAWVELEYVPDGAPCGIVVHDVDGEHLLATCGYHPTVVYPR